MESKPTDGAVTYAFLPTPISKSTTDCTVLPFAAYGIRTTHTSLDASPTTYTKTNSSSASIILPVARDCSLSTWLHAISSWNASTKHVT